MDVCILCLWGVGLRVVLSCSISWQVFFQCGLLYCNWWPTPTTWSTDTFQRCNNHTTWKNKIHSTLASVAENLGELATRRCLCICTAWKPRSPCWLLPSFVLLWPVISKAKYELESNVTWPHAICQMILWFLVRKMRRFPRNRFMHVIWDSWCHFWTVNSAFCFFTMFWLLLVQFWRAGGAHEQLEDPSSLTQELVKPPTRKVEVLYGEGQDVLPYKPPKHVLYHLLSCPIMSNGDKLCK